MDVPEIVEAGSFFKGLEVSVLQKRLASVFKFFGD